MNTRLFFIVISIFTGAVAVTSPAYAKDPIYTGRFSNLAVSGYDPVAYFTQSRPVKGSSDYEYSYKGAQWRFSSMENLERFQANPDAYAPQYGGYCAWAAAQNYTARGNPKYWTVVDGKLYINYNAKIQARWEKDIPGFIAKANANWPGILN